MKTPTISRADYMAGKATHREYYAQFVTLALLQRIRRLFIFARLQNSTDTHFNDIPLAEWDRLFCAGCPSGINNAMRAAGDYPTAAGLVCLAKEAARQLVEEAAK